MSRDLSRRTSTRLPLILTGIAIAVALGVGAYAWYDHLMAENTAVAGNVTFADRRLDGADGEAVRSAVTERELELLTNTVAIETPQGDLVFELGQLGYSYDGDQARSDLLRARHRGGFLSQFYDWATTIFNPIVVDDPISLDRARAGSILSRTAGLTFSHPSNPEVAMTEDGFLVATLGSDGFAADIDDLVDQLRQIRPTDDTLRLATKQVSIPPMVSEAEAGRVVDEINEATRKGVRIIVSGEARDLTPRSLRNHIVATVEDGVLTPRFNISGLQEEIESLYPDPVGEAGDPTFEVDGESVEVLEPGFPAEICCDPYTAPTIGEALLAGADGPFNVRAKPETDPVIAAWYDGSLITEQVSTFTTRHGCCENRVKNIQRMADLVRGVYLVPGEVISLNEYIGPRTIAKGFLPAGAIRQGRLTPEVGGGVSQFATTIFNAAYFAGLDFVEYQAHSLYFSRYPYGREATISNPAPDLVFENTTEYPVLIWTSYTSTSITVSMYSTQNVEAEQVATRSSKRNRCTYVETDRQRTYDDGRVVVDTFFALYRPADGIDCNGNQIPK